MGLQENQQQQVLSGLSVAILVADGFEQVELTGPRYALEAAGATTSIVSLRSGTIRGRNQDQEGDEFEVSLAIDASSPQDFDALLLPGGELNGRRMQGNLEAQRFVQEMQAEGKPIAAICHGSSLLISAGIARGHILTGAAGLQQAARAAGATWADQAVVVDGNLVSSRGTKDLPAFNEAAVDVLRRRVASSVAGTDDETLGSGSGS